MISKKGGRETRMKTLLKSLAASILVLTLAMSTVLAAPSSSKNGTVTGATSGSTSVSVAFFSTFTGISTTETSIISKLNGGTAAATALSGESVTGLPAGISLSNLSLLTAVQDLKSTNGTTLTNVTVSWTVPNLTTSANVYVLHYNTATGKWEIIKPKSVNLSTKVITATFANLSPVAVVISNVAAAKKPGKTTITYAKSKSRKKLTVKYKKVTSAAGYQIAYRKKGTSKWKYTTTKGKSKTISWLTRKKYYYVKVRAYKVVSGTKLYGSFTTTKKVKIK